MDWSKLDGASCFCVSYSMAKTRQDYQPTEPCNALLGGICRLSIAAWILTFAMVTRVLLLLPISCGRLSCEQSQTLSACSCPGALWRNGGRGPTGRHRGEDTVPGRATSASPRYPTTNPSRELKRLRILPFTTKTNIVVGSYFRSDGFSSRR